MANARYSRVSLSHHYRSFASPNICCISCGQISPSSLILFKHMYALFFIKIQMAIDCITHNVFEITCKTLGLRIFLHSQILVIEAPFGVAFKIYFSFLIPGVLHFAILSRRLSILDFLNIVNLFHLEKIMCRFFASLWRC